MCVFLRHCDVRAVALVTRRATSTPTPPCRFSEPAADPIENEQKTLPDVLQFSFHVSISVTSDHFSPKGHSYCEPTPPVTKRIFRSLCRVAAYIYCM